MKHSPGHCPKCNSDQIEYGSSEILDDCIAYEMECCDCEFTGYELDNISFNCFLDEDRNEVSEN